METCVIAFNGFGSPDEPAVRMPSIWPSNPMHVQNSPFLIEFKYAEATSSGGKIPAELLISLT